MEKMTFIPKFIIFSIFNIFEYKFNYILSRYDTFMKKKVITVVRVPKKVFIPRK